MKNSDVIDQPDYYLLPCGKHLEDFIYYKRLNFNMGCAVKYRWRAGHKDGETEHKDLSKAQHYVEFEAGCRNVDWKTVDIEVNDLVREAKKWDGEMKEDPQVADKLPGTNLYWARRNCEASLRILSDLIFIANEREYSGIVALAVAIGDNIRRIGTLCNLADEEAKKSWK